MNSDQLLGQPMGRGLLIAAIAPLLAGAVLLTAARLEYSKISAPTKLSISDARARLNTLPQGVVTLTGPIDRTRKLYNLVPHSDVLLKPWSPKSGIPLTGPDALLKEQWKLIEGGYVSADSSAEWKVYLYEKSVLGNGRESIELTSRYILARLGLSDLYALSGGHLVYSTFGGEPPLDDSETQWLSSRVFKGELHQLASGTSKLRGDDLKPLLVKAGLSGSQISSGWLIDTTERFSGGGLSVYLPFENQNDVWVQFPIETDLVELPPEFTGMWIPPGKRKFQPSEMMNVALLRIAPDLQAEFIAERWRADWGRNVSFAAYAAFGLSALIWLAGFIDARYFKPGLPDFLKPYSKYFVPEPTWLRIVRMSAGTLFAVLALAAFLAHMIARDNIRHNRTDFPTRTIALADELAIIPASSLLFWLAIRCFARGAAMVMRNDSRRPVLYLRSFRTDAPFWQGAGTSEHHLMRALQTLGPPIAIGAPNRLIPPIGAARLRVADEGWQGVVAQLIANAQVIVLRIGETDGFWWEMRHLVQSVEPGRVMIYVPPEDRGEVYGKFRRRADALLAHPLPQDPRNASFIAFSADWTPILLAPEGPSIRARIRRWLGNGRGPGLREALRQKFSIEPMRMSAAEWGAVIFLGGSALQIALSFAR